MKTFKEFLAESADEWNHEGWHGTPDKRGIMKDGFRTLKHRHNGDDPEAVYWATDNHKVARTYADPHRAFDYQNSEPAVLRVQMRMKNPKHIHWGGKKFHHQKEDGSWDHIDHHIKKAREEGHDGVIIHNIIDNYHADHKKGSTIKAVFHHSNIRVAT